MKMFATVVLVLGVLDAAALAAEPRPVIPLWPNGAPGSASLLNTDWSD